MRSEQITLMGRAAAWLAFLSIIPGVAWPQGPTADVAAAFIGYTVRITAGFSDSSEEDGFGLITGVQGGRAYVATADHVVRHSSPGQTTDASRIEVRFAANPARAFTANLLPVRIAQGEGDLAAIEISVPASFTGPALPMEPSYALEPGVTRAWRIGKAGRWVPPLMPGQFVGRSGAFLLDFDDLDTPIGSSGGPIVGTQGLIGIVISSAGFGGASQVLPSDIIGGKFREWQLPWSFRLAGIVPPPAGRPAFPAAPAPSLPAARLTPADMDRMARGLVSTYFAALSSGAPRTTRVLEQAYGPMVMLGSQPTARADAIEQKRELAVQWPEQRWSIDPASLTTRCSQVVATCQVTVRVAWQRGSAETGIRSGSSIFSFSVAFPQGQPRILIEREVRG